MGLIVSHFCCILDIPALGILVSEKKIVFTTKQCIQALASVVLENTFPIISLYGRYLFVWTTKHCYIHNIEALGLVFSHCKSIKDDD